MKQEVVITGVGVVTPIGVGKEEFWQSLLDGVSGIRIRPNFADTELPFRLYAPVTDFDGRKLIKPRKALKVMCLPVQFGVGAARMAFLDAGLDDYALDVDRVATVFGTETYFANPLEVASVFRKCMVGQEYQHARWGEFAMREIQPLWMLKYLPNMVASHISIGLDARGPSNSICQGEASGLLAILEAADLIRRGVADVAIAGGTGSRLSLTSMLYRGTDILSKRISEPTRASRPFDNDRDGMVAGEGSGAIILESREHAERRGAQCLATLAGSARAFAPSLKMLPEILAENIRHTAQNANLATESISFVNAHAAGSVTDDPMEAQGIADVLGKVPVVANKGNFGNLGPGSSAVEFVSSVLSVQHRKLPRTLNFDTPSDECPVQVASETQDLAVDRELGEVTGLKVSISSMGQVATAALLPGHLD